MAAMKSRTDDGPLEAVKEGKKIATHAPADGGGHLVVELSLEEAKELGVELVAVVE